MPTRTRFWVQMAAGRPFAKNLVDNAHPTAICQKRRG